MARKDGEQEPNIEGHGPEPTPASEREPMAPREEAETSRDRAEFNPTSSGDESGEVM